MGRHHRTSADAVLIELDPTLRRGRHREETSGPGAGLKAATVAAATGAIITAGAQLGAGSAAAAPAPAPLQVPAGLLPAGVELPQLQLPALPAAPALPTAQELIQQDLSIGYLSHDAETVELYFQESLTFLTYTGEASVALGAR